MGRGPPREGMWPLVAGCRVRAPLIQAGVQALLVAGCGDGLWGRVQAALGSCREVLWGPAVVGECGHGFNHPPDPQCRVCWLLIISGYQGRRTFGVPAWADPGALTRLSLPPGLLGSQGRRAGSDWPSPGCCAGASLAGCSTQFQRVS